MINDRMDVNEWLRKQLEAADPDLSREMVRAFAETLMSADADETCGAPYGTVSPDRVKPSQRVSDSPLGYPAWGRSTCGSRSCGRGPISPTGSLTPAPGQSGRSCSVEAEAYLRGVSTRRVEGLVETLGIASLSKSQVSEIAKDLDELVDHFRNRPLDRGPYRYVWADALFLKVREGGRVVNVALLHAVGVNGDGHREILGLELSTAEDGAGWLSFWRSLVARGLSGVQLVISDDHRGLVEAIKATLPGASWQR